MSALIDGNPAYEKVRLIYVDWDTYRRDTIVSELKIPRRSTLVMFSNGDEVERVIAATSKSQIKSLFDAALATE